MKVSWRDSRWLRLKAKTELDPVFGFVLAEPEGVPTVYVFEALSPGDEPELLGTVYLTWDGCANVRLGYMHCCSPRDWEETMRAIIAGCYEVRRPEYAGDVEGVEDVPPEDLAERIPS